MASKKTAVKAKAKGKAKSAPTKEEKTVRIKSSSPEEDLAEAIAGKDGVSEAIAMSSEAVIGHIHKVVTTGSVAIDKLTGIGGLPFGRLVEVAGKEQSGKTTLAQQVASNTQKMGGVVGLFDAEEKWDRRYAEMCNVDLTKCMVIQPAKLAGNKTIESGIEAIDEAANTWMTKGYAGKTPLTPIWDSIAATPTGAELEDMKSKQPGVAAKELRRAMRVLTSKAARAGALLLFINQTYEKIGAFGFGPKTATYGGGGLRYHATLRLELVRTGQLKHSSGLILGIEGEARLTKSSLGVSGKTDYAIANGRGFDNAWSLLQKLKDAGYVSGNATRHTLKLPEGEPVSWAGGFAELDAILRADAELFDRMRSLYLAIP